MKNKGAAFTNNDQEGKDQTNMSKENQANESDQATNETNSKQLAVEETEQDKSESLEKEYAELKDKYLRLYSDFDNYKKRSIKERSELIKSAGEDIFLSLLPALDDFERALKSINTATDINALKEGVKLIYSKLYNTLQQKGLKEMPSQVGEPFNTDLHDAITNMPAPSEDMKGKVIDEMEKGYYLNGRVIRHSKVVVGS
jgi:molecular chaperone GrpE